MKYYNNAYHINLKQQMTQQSLGTYSKAEACACLLRSSKSLSNYNCSSARSF